MISIVFCSKDPKTEYIEHLKSSCGVKDVEVIPIKNIGLHSLAQSYNYGLEKSKYDTVVFTHDDVAFNTKPWGYKTLKHFEKNPEFGILGLAGTDYMSDGMWWKHRENMLGKVFHQNNGKRWVSQYSKTLDNKVVEVVTVDGVFIAVRKDRIKKGFNETFSGFHFYDIPFCVDNHMEGVKVGVFTNIDLTHFSVGQINQQWKENKVLFDSIYESVLPLKIKRDILIPKERDFRFKKTPKVSIIIPTKDRLDLLLPCLKSIYEKTKYPNYEVIIADTGSTDDNKQTIREFIKQSDVTRLLEYDYYHFARINNEVVETIDDGELIVFCNNDVELINDVISRMVNLYQTKRNVGTIGCRLHYDDNSIQHNGINITLDTVKNQYNASHIDANLSYDYTLTDRKVLGSTAALLMISKDLFDGVGGFNEEYRHCFEDVQLSMDTLINGKDNYMCSTSVAYHKESQTRSHDTQTLNEIKEDFMKILLNRVVEGYDKLVKHLTVIK